MRAHGSLWPLAEIPSDALDVAFGVKRTWLFVACPLLRSLLGVKRTWLVAALMSAFDLKRTLRQFGPYLDGDLNLYDAPF